MAQEFNKKISEEEVIAEFSTRRTKVTRLAVSVGILAVGTLVFLYQGVASDTIMIILLVLIFVAAVYMNIKIWRCPSCKGHLGKLYLGLKGPTHCPNCGIRLLRQ